ncbi:S8 family serine peptidase [Thiocapsa imhoffii]|uniref:S8 family serine peptidase n=1 Tax=Thiocapsa imhoffii TaxID=382777 RepID=UPI00190816CD
MIGQHIVLMLALVMIGGAHAGMPEAEGDPSARATDWEFAIDQFTSAARLGHRNAAAAQRALLARAWADGTVRIIVRMKDSQIKTGSVAADVRAQRAAKRRELLDAVGLRLSRDRSGLPVKAFEQFAGFAMWADAFDILDLAAHPDVAEVIEDVPYPPALLESVPLIGALAASFSGYTGLGQTVAVLDTGVDKHHPQLVGKVVSEACYSTNGSFWSGVVSLCPNRVTASTAVGAAQPCNVAQWGSSCHHGTHVAGIVAGHQDGYSGVAKDANIIAIQVFSAFPSSQCGGSPCVMAYTSDIIKGLERVLALHQNYRIAAANLSLGGGRYTSHCDQDPHKEVIDALRERGIATIVASGNAGYVNALGAPACVSTAVSVGSTCDTQTTHCAGVDAVASYSNSAAFLDLLGPGSLITSAVAGGGYQSWHGTSMAAPHVAGAWAVLKEAYPTAGVDQILAALQETGKPVADLSTGITKPRIRPDAALAWLERESVPVSEPGLPEPEPVVSIPVMPPQAPVAHPASNVAADRFRANWADVSEALGYRLDVATDSAFQSGVPGYLDLDIKNGTNRSVSGLTAGTSYFYRVRAYNDAGVSGNSNVQTLTTRDAVAAPGAPSLRAPTNVTSNGFRLSWEPVEGASGYRLDISTWSTFRTRLAGYNDLDLGSQTQRTVTGLRRATTYYVRLRAYNAAGVSAHSPVISVRTAFW